MMSGASRRQIVLALGGLAVRPAAASAADAAAVGALERQHGGRLGAFALDTGTGEALTYRADERFMLFSTFKGVLAAAVLADIEAGQEDPRARVPYTAADLLPASPVTSAHLGEGALTVEALCRAIMHQSDNAAANLLLARRGGPARLTAFVRALGDTVTRFDRYETAAGEPSGVLDTTTPRAIATTLRALLLGQGLSGPSRATLEAWMAGNAVGRARLRAAFPADWAAGDRTGTGDGYCNDCAFARRPGKAPLVMSVYYDAPGLTLVQQETVLRKVGAAIVAWQA
jgi:beta-lactamase class A